MRFIKIANECICTHMESCHYGQTRKPMTCNCSDGACYNCGEYYESTMIPHERCNICGQMKNCINTDASTDGIVVEASKAFNIPENFDVLEQFKNDRISIWGGGNDWEPGITAVCARTESSWRGEQEQVWFQVSCPKDVSYDDLANGRTNKDEDEVVSKHGEKAWKKWVSIAKRITNDDDLSGVRLKYFKEALKDPEMKSYVKESGHDRTEWKSL